MLSRRVCMFSPKSLKVGQCSKGFYISEIFLFQKEKVQISSFVLLHDWYGYSYYFIYFSLPNYLFNIQKSKLYVKCCITIWKNKN